MCNLKWTHKFSLDFKLPAKGPVQYLGERKRKGIERQQENHNEYGQGQHTRLAVTVLTSVERGSVEDDGVLYVIAAVAHDSDHGVLTSRDLVKLDQVDRLQQHHNLCHNKSFATSMEKVLHMFNFSLSFVRSRLQTGTKCRPCDWPINTYNQNILFYYQEVCNFI